MSLSQKVLSRLVALFCLVVSALTCLNAQQLDSLSFSQKEIILRDIYDQISELQGKERLQAEIVFRDSLLSFLKTDESIEFQFQDLKKIGKIISDDGKLVIYTWNIPQPAGYSNYYGIIQYVPKKKTTPLVFSLIEKPDILSKYRQAPSDTSNWIGALYYKIITTKYKGQSWYTLLGFSFNNILSNIKVVEVIAFDENQKPYFPAKPFLFGGIAQQRIVFEYNEKAQMTLEYRPERGMIVFDHLSPMKPSLAEQFQFYGPDSSYDGLLFEEGKWIQKEDIPATN